MESRRWKVKEWQKEFDYQFGNSLHGLTCFDKFKVQHFVSGELKRFIAILKLATESGWDEVVEEVKPPPGWKK